LSECSAPKLRRQTCGFPVMNWNMRCIALDRRLGCLVWWYDYSFGSKKFWGIESGRRIIPLDQVADHTVPTGPLFDPSEPCLVVSPVASKQSTASLVQRLGYLPSKQVARVRLPDDAF